MKRLINLASLLIVIASLISAVPSTYGQGRKKGSNKKKTSSKAKVKKESVIWADPGRIESLDFVYGPGGRANEPKPPFTFLEEDDDGSNPKIKVTDARGIEWSVKFGSEVNAEVFASRMAWAVGYFVEPSYFVPRGRIQGVTKLSRAKKYIESDGSFTDGRFELKESDIKKRKDKKSWSWAENPFIGTPELNGLKIIVMLTSNWDNKDVRDAGRGSNTAIFEIETEEGVESRYLITDWGGSMGKWGGVFTREKWDCKGFASQTKDFVEGIKKGEIEFGYKGQHTGEFKSGIGVQDARWILRYLGRITDAQIRAGLKASGADSEEIACFSAALRVRIKQLQAIAR